MKQILSILFGLLLTSLVASAQQRTTDYGLSLSAELDKAIGRKISLAIEEELRLTSSPAGFDRNVLSIGADYALFQRKLKIGASYAFMYLYNNDRYFEVRHRYYANISYKESVGQFTFSWRGRLQGTRRDEDLGDYKINPKYLLKNKLQVEYAIWGRPWKPFVSCDFYSTLNNPMGNELSRIRYQCGTAWRLNRTDYLDFFLRYDQQITDTDAHTLSMGICYKVKL